MDRLEIGKKGEEYAKKFLLAKGCKVLEENFYSRFGELDIIAVEGETLLFVEVKTRTSDKFGDAEEAVDRRKIEKILKTALHFLSETSRKHYDDLRMDLIVVRLNGRHELERIKHIKNIRDG